MKLYMVMLIFGKIAATAGPLPYGMHECKLRGDERMQDFRVMWKAAHEKGLIVKIDGKEVGINDHVIECLWADKRPQIDKFKDSK